MATHSSCLENPMDGAAWQAMSMGLQRSDTTEPLQFFFFFFGMCRKILYTKFTIIFPGWMY